MRRYTFPLATVLRVRRRQEDVARAGVAAAATAERERVRRLEERRARYAAATAAGAAGVVTVEELTRARVHAEHLGAAVGAARDELRNARATLAAQRGEYAAAAARRELLERLDARHRADYDRETRAAEEREASDVDAARRHRGRDD